MSRLPFTAGSAQRSHAGALALTLACALIVSACKPSGAQAPAGGNAPPAPQVGVVTVQPGDVGLVAELPGRLEASRVAEVRARAAGILQKRTFTEGSEVKAGQQLFLIDNAPYRASVAQAKASLAQAEASLAQSRALAERYAPLVAQNAVSKQDYDNAVAARQAGEANVAAARAAVTAAQINLDYARVTAPISGRIGRALVTEGALVGQGSPTQLALIQQIDPLYINFTQSAADALKLRAQLASGKYKAAGADAAKVTLVLEDGSIYPHPGKLLFTDLSVDPSSGQVMLRAEVPNPEHALLPGLYVRVRLEQAQADNAVLLPQQAVTRTAAGDSVLVVGEGGKLAPRPVKLGPSQGDNWVVLDGLTAGEQVMVDGFQKLPRSKPGEPVIVQPVPWKAPGAAGDKAAAPAAKS
ncbi:efflux RND transporter periplasmic adaptor subunit [Comamonas flocculans]|uniref:Efflux RND transporter periplasmic adaptor subunit n=1 Tax=Comamonas flocculans TaxID=2597701 RepID=A0A5B8RUF3_9BURK|nr:efflux RND transporter periplasmic adaptor subunit [Comamonas flocculans]QEA12448.1 efflux RND transporter periplasmic adaptor subunit [Comamonas flocculans]